MVQIDLLTGDLVLYGRGDPAVGVRCYAVDTVPAGADAVRRAMPHFIGLHAIQALALIARAAEGSARDGLSIMDQAIALGSGTVTAPTRSAT